MVKGTKGFTLVEILLVVVALAALVGLGVYVYQANQNKATTSAATGQPGTQSNAQTPAKPQNPTYTDPNFNYSFSYPSGWQTHPSSDKYASMSAQSPDYAFSTQGVGFIVTKGASLGVSVANTTSTTSADFIKGNSFLSYAATNLQPTKVAGIDATQYKETYESNPTLNTVVIKGGEAYTISISYANDAALQAYQADYDAMVASFKFN